MKKIIPVLTVVLSALFFTSPVLAGSGEGAALTLMVYMCGSNLESRGGAGSKDLLEMASSGYDPSKVNLLVMTGGSKRWALNLPKDSLCIYTPDGDNLKMLEAYDSASMGDPACLKTLLDYGYTNYPASNYALILWNHGGGPMNGVCIDELYRADTLTMEELHSALAASPAADEKLEWIGFDACLMGSAEVAELMSPFARYMIASEETEPGNGWDYSFLRGLEADEDGAATARRIIDGYFAAADDGFDLTLSCVDLSKLENLKARLDTLFESMEIGNGNYALFSFAAGNTRSFGKAAGDDYSYDLIDLQALIEMLSPQQEENARLALEALDDAVVCTKNTRESGGLSVYHPYENKADYAGSWSELYPTLGFSEGYTDYITRFAGYLFGSCDVSWENLCAAPTSEAGIFALPLTPGQQEMLSGAVMHVLAWNESEDSYSCICTVNQLTLEDGVLYAPCPEQILTAAGSDGSVLISPIPYEVRPDGTLSVYVNFCMENASGSPEASELVAARTEGLKRDFGSYSFDTDDAASSGMNDTDSSGSSSVSSAGSDIDTSDTQTATTSSLSAAYSSTQAVTTVVSPMSASELEQTLTPPGTLSLNAAVSPVSSSGFSMQQASSLETATITPVSSQSMSHANTGSVTIGSAGSDISLSSLTPVGTASFHDEQISVSLTDVTLETPDKEQQPEVLHAMLQCRVSEDGSVEILETWLYDAESDSWSTRGSFDESLYPQVTFPSAWKLPAATGDSLRGFSDWTLHGSTAAAAGAQDWHLCFLPRTQTEDVCISFEVTDLQHQTHGSIPMLF